LMQKQVLQQGEINALFLDWMHTKWMDPTHEIVAVQQLSNSPKHMSWLCCTCNSSMTDPRGQLFPLQPTCEQFLCRQRDQWHSAEVWQARSEHGGCVGHYKQSTSPLKKPNSVMPNSFLVPNLPCALPFLWKATSGVCPRPVSYFQSFLLH
jgi:hypothetical protein